MKTSPPLRFCLIMKQETQCGNFKKSLSQFLRKNYVKSTYLLLTYTISGFKIQSESKFLVFSHCVEEDSLELFDTVCHSGFLLSTENKHDTFETLKVAKNSLIGTMMMIVLVLLQSEKKESGISIPLTRCQIPNEGKQVRSGG